MDSVSTLVVGTLLLFPWSILAVILAGALWQRRAVRARVRSCR